MTSKKNSGFPELIYNNEEVSTRPIPLGEQPQQVQIDHNMEIIRTHHPRIASAIEMFWGHKDCVEYLQQLILSGGDGVGRARVGFKQEVVEALMHLITLHQAQHT